MTKDETKLHLEQICLIGQGAACCKYITATPVGIRCAKADLYSKMVVDQSWAIHEHVAQGDNCEGRKDLGVE